MSPKSEVCDAVDAAIIENEKLPVGTRRNFVEIADEFKVSSLYVRTRVKLLRQRGALPQWVRRAAILPAFRTGAPTEPAAPRPDAPQPRLDFGAILGDAESWIGRIQRGETLTVEERKAVLTLISVFGRDADKNAAIKTLEDIEGAKTEARWPPPPASRTDLISDVSKILQAAGRDAADEAWRLAFAESSPGRADLE